MMNKIIYLIGIYILYELLNDKEFIDQLITPHLCKI